mmetsp:Transcript_6188/g.18665  ORF Transcript_6188/g.18665 Transcript_6188/m.18665 type:complete len:84 (+) Transcript_6188:165-416(+)
MEARVDEGIKAKGLFAKSLPTSPFFSMLKATPAKADAPASAFELRKPVGESNGSIEAAKLQRGSSMDKTAQALIDFKDIWLSP